VSTTRPKVGTGIRFVERRKHPKVLNDLWAQSAQIAIKPATSTGCMAMYAYTSRKRPLLEQSNSQLNIN
jgi:hypothetical protein